MIIDTNRGIHFCSLEDQNMTFHDYTAVKILEKSNFIGFCCNSNKIWGLNSKRQVLIANLATEGKEANTEKKAKQNIIFEPYNDIFNVMKISSNGNQN